MDFKNLVKVIKLCRKHGINHFKNGDLELGFNHLQPRRRLTPVKQGKVDLEDLTEEQKLFWSSHDELGRELNG